MTLLVLFSTTLLSIVKRWGRTAWGRRSLTAATDRKAPADPWRDRRRQAELRDAGSPGFV